MAAGKKIKPDLLARRVVLYGPTAHQNKLKKLAYRLASGPISFASFFTLEVEKAVNPRRGHSGPAS
jgi:hypothetical protein